MPALVAATAGETLLASEVAAPLFDASASFIPTAGTLSTLPAMEGMSMGLGALNGLGGAMGAVGSGLGQLVGQGLAGTAPEAAAQVSNALAQAAPGANQVAAQTMGNLGTPAQSAMNAASQNFDPSVMDRFAGAQQLFNPNAVPAQSAMMQGAVESLPSLTPEQMAQREALYGDAGYGAGAGVTPPSGLDKLLNTVKDYGSSAYQWWNKQDTPHQMLYGGAGLLGANALFGKKPGGVPEAQGYSGPLSRFQYDPSKYNPTIAQQPSPYYQPTYQNYRSYADGGMLDAGANPGMQMQGGNDPLAFQSTGVERMASGGISSLGGYSDGGRMLKGPGDGMSDDIPATIADKQPARLANDEFVVPADVVSHLGNGSSDAGAKQLYKMMDRVRQARTGNKAQGKEINPDKYMPA